jgi:hypothetical protein
MNRLFRFLNYPFLEQLTLVQVSLLLVSIRIALFLLPFSTMSRLTRRAGRPESELDPNQIVSMKRILWAINRAGGSILRDRACLTQALAGQVLLNRCGISTRVKIGVLKDPEGHFQAHAWLENDGQLLLGGKVADLEHYTVLPDWDAA